MKRLLESEKLSHSSSNDRPEAMNQPSKGERTRQAIIDRASELFRVHPYRDVNAGLIMDTLPQAKATFYRYFESVVDIVGYLIDDFVTTFQQRDRTWYTAESRPEVIQGLRSTLDNVCTLGVDKAFCLRVAREAMASDDRASMIYKKFTDSVEETLIDNIKRQQDLGIVRADLDADFVGKSICALNIDVLIRYFGGNDQGDPMEASRGLQEVWVATLYGEVK